MINLTFEIGGRKVEPNSIVNALERIVLQKVRETTEGKIGDIRDPVTGERPHVVARGGSLDNLSFEVSGSEALVAEAKRRLGEG